MTTSGAVVVFFGASEKTHRFGLQNTSIKIPVNELRKKKRKFDGTDFYDGKFGHFRILTKISIAVRQISIFNLNFINNKLTIFHKMEYFHAFRGI